MNRLLESRFMQTAISGIPRQISEQELNTEFGEFQLAIRELLFGGHRIMDTDFILNDTLAVLDSIETRKKKCGIAMFD